jgi:hypothetical protein
MFFQIHKNGMAVDGCSYPSLEEASKVLEKAAEGGEVTQVDASDKIIRRYTPEECRLAARKFRTNAGSGRAQATRLASF